MNMRCFNSQKPVDCQFRGRTDIDYRINCIARYTLLFNQRRTIRGLLFLKKDFQDLRKLDVNSSQTFFPKFSLQTRLRNIELPLVKAHPLCKFKQNNSNRSA